MKRKLRALFLSLFLMGIGLSVSAQSNWAYMGHVFAHYGDPNGYSTESVARAELYSSFDGEKVLYKLIVNGSVYTAYHNPNFSQSAYDDYVKRSSKDHYHGPHLKNCECYPYVAGKYRFNPAHSFK